MTQTLLSYAIHNVTGVPDNQDLTEIEELEPRLASSRQRCVENSVDQRFFVHSFTDRCTQKTKWSRLRTMRLTLSSWLSKEPR
jgi:hypothetical protein